LPIFDCGKHMHKTLLNLFLNSSSDNRKSKACPEPRRRIQNRKWAGLFAIVVALTACGARAEAQQPKKIPRIGYLSAFEPALESARSEAIRVALRELGYIEGQNIAIEYRYGEGKRDRAPEVAAELVRLKVEIIVVAGGASWVQAAKDANKTIPIVFAQEADPVGSGFVASLARPGGNITGLSTLGPELAGKRLELLKETVPKLSRVAVLGTSTIRGHARFLKEQEPAAVTLGVKLQFLDILDPKDIESAFRAASKGRADGLLVLSGPVLNSHRTQVLDLAVKSRLPAIYNFPEFVEAGGLMTYGVSNTDLSRRAATYVDKILKGAKPADLLSSSQRSSSSSSISKQQSRLV